MYKISLNLNKIDICKPHSTVIIDSSFIGFLIYQLGLSLYSKTMKLGGMTHKIIIANWTIIDINLHQHDKT